MKKWKRYVGIEEKHKYLSYPYYSSNKDFKGQNHPGTISNSDIIRNLEECYISDDLNASYNIGLLQGKLPGIDYELLNEIQWNYLHNKYFGTPIRMTKRNYSLLSKTAEIRLIVLPKKTEFKINLVSSPKFIYISKEWTIDELEKKVVKILNAKYNFHLTIGKLKFWQALLSLLHFSCLYLLHVAGTEKTAVFSCTCMYVSTFLLRIDPAYGERVGG